MYKNKKIAVVIPSYNVANYIIKVIDSIPDFIDIIISIDDKCPQQSGYLVTKHFKQNNSVKVLFHNKNKGVGAAVKSGYKEAIRLGADIVVKIDGDGQMDTKWIEKLIDPIIDNVADYTKGNRFTDSKILKVMPKIRLFGNSILSFMLKAASGYWDIMDPTNGYTAINKESIQKLNLDEIANRYFFESDMLINLNIEKCVVKDIAIPALYGNEESSLNILNVALKFPFKIFKGFIKRISINYFIYSFNIASIYILFGVFMSFFGFTFGVYHWVVNMQKQISTPTGTIMLSVLPLIIGFQLILQAITYDINNIPKK